MHGVWELDEGDRYPFNLLATTSDVHVEWLVDTLTFGTGELDDRPDAPLVTVQYRVAFPDTQASVGSAQSLPSSPCSSSSDSAARASKDRHDASASPTTIPTHTDELAFGQARGVWGLQATPATVSVAPSAAHAAEAAAHAVAVGPYFLFLNLEMPGGIPFHVACLLRRDAADEITLTLLQKETDKDGRAGTATFVPSRVIGAFTRIAR